MSPTLARLKNSRYGGREGRGDGRVLAKGSGLFGVFWLPRHLSKFLD
jgi:hypothetical protein